MTQAELIDVVEKLVDSTSFARVTEAMATVARCKAEHLLENWQDKNTAKCWEICGTALDGAARRIRLNIGE